MNKIKPPHWADRFLAWYCDPERLEEIQGDAYELYHERLGNFSKQTADLLYVYDVIRFMRWSNLNREWGTNIASITWSFNFKLAARQARRHKLIFTIKVLSLSLCLAFTLLLSSFIINELSFDKFHVNAQRLVRIGSEVDFHDQITRYAVSPLPIGPMLTEEIPEVENYTRLIYNGKPLITVDDIEINSEVALTVDSNFLDLFFFPMEKGGSNPLDGPNKVVLTHSLAKKLFGRTEPLGQRIAIGQSIFAEVTAILQDVPKNSHLKFDLLISWDTFQHDDDWSNINAYTYILLRPGADVQFLTQKIDPSLDDLNELVARNYDGVYRPFFEKLTEIHFSAIVDEDIAEKQSNINVLILTHVAILFLITGLINYVNISLAEVAANLKQLGIIQIFGGISTSHRKMLLSGTLFTLLIISPVVLLLTYFGWHFGANYFSIQIDKSVVTSYSFIAIVVGCLLLILLSSQGNFIAIRISDITQTLKDKLGSYSGATPFRKALVGIQFTFSIAIMAIILLIIDQFYFIQNTDKGFNDENTILIEVPTGSQSKIELFNATVRDIEGVVSVGGSSYSPGIVETRYVFGVETSEGTKELLLPMIHCGYDYLKTIEVSTTQGRGFDPEHSGDQYYSFLVNETAAKEFGWRNAVGKSIKGPIEGTGNFVLREGEVIGVVKDFNFASLHSKIEPLIIFMSDDGWSDQFVYLRANSNMTSEVVGKIQRSFDAFWPDFPFNWQYLDTKYLSFYEKDRQIKNIFEIGFIISLVVSCLGIFSFSALLASARMRELGIRKVLGADMLNLLLLHLRTFLILVSICILVALPIIYYWGVHWLGGFAYHIDLQIEHFAIPAVFATISVVAMSGYHAMKNAAVNPTEVLKHT
ncbi:MAG: ABC transporter permease [Cyclobacteriaceae bacterium]